MIAVFSFSANPVAHAILLLSAVAATGLALGSIKFRGIALGTAGVLFAGIVFGHYGEKVNHEILDFVKEFGLVLFVFTIGLQLGPGFVAALRQQGLKLNVLAVLIVGGGALTAWLGSKIAGVDYAATLGLFSGATTNTPSLGAGNQALGTLPDVAEARKALPALAYAVAYPVGIAGIIGSLLMLRAIFKIDPAKEAAEFAEKQKKGIEPLDRVSLVIESRGLQGVPLAEAAIFKDAGVVVSRWKSRDGGEIQAATPATVLHVGDTVLAVGTRTALAKVLQVAGVKSDEDLAAAPGLVGSQRVVVTRREVLGKSVQEMAFVARYGVTMTRIGRGDVEMSASPGLRLRFGDVVQLVGEKAGLEQAGKELGNAPKALNEMHFVPFFVGIALGVIAGLIPIRFPGLPVPVKLGIAGGPLIVGIILSRLGHIGRLVWHVPHTANMALREFGITLFLAAVGLMAGEKFFATVFTSTGLTWLAVAACIAVLPLMIIGIIARAAMKLSYTTISGLIAGSTTDPPALAFAGLMAKSDGPYVAYATVYPLTMLLRILTAQVLALVLCG